MSVHFFSHEISFTLKNKTKIKKWITEVIEKEEKKLNSVTYVFCSDNYLLEINQGFLNHDYYTDIITFDYSTPEAIEGEIYISIDRVKENAKNLKVDFESELHRVIIHGILHLCGHKDKTQSQQEEIRSAEDDCLALL